MMRFMGKKMILLHYNTMFNGLNGIALIFVLLAIATHYIDFWLGISNSGNSISVGLLAAGTTLINFQAQKGN